MNDRKLVALGILSAMAGTAQAQSSVVLYGILDANAGLYRTNQLVGSGATATIQSPNVKKLDSGGLSGSRWGIRIAEDLGDGLSAVANLESGFALDTGTFTQGGRAFGRRAMVGLSSKSLGTLTLGRNTTSYNDVAFDHTMMEATPFDPSTNNVSSSPATAVTLNTLSGKASLLNHSGAGAGAQQSWLGFNSRFDNSFKYTTPNIAGVTGSLTYGLGEDQTATQPASQSTSASLKYSSGPLIVSGGYSSEGSAINQTTGAKPSLQNALVSVAYNFGPGRLGVGFNRAQYKGVTATGGDLAAQKEINVSVAVPVGLWLFSAGYARSNGSDLGKSSGYGVQAFYIFSKRTLLYMGGVSTKNYDKVVSSAELQAARSDIGRTVIYGLGIRHMF